MDIKKQLEISNLKNLTFKTYLDFCAITNGTPRTEITESINSANSLEVLDTLCERFFDAIRDFAKQTKNL